ncbi:MAG: aminopeptidase P family protein [Clostridia bacterium]|nr:aminopeptidase P family protein [Clostridia bacterium]
MEKTREILKAVSVAYQAFKHAFAIGKNSDELFSVFENSLKQSLGAYEIVYDYIWGKDSLHIDGVTQNYLPNQGDTLVMDISVGKDGVWCDVCRTFFVGEPTKRQAEVFQMVVRSLRQGQASMKVGARALDVYRAVDGVYALHGKKLIHHAGHRIGEKPLLQPQFLEENETLLENGKVYTVESGLYEEFGLRLENDYYLTDGEAVDLFEDLLPLDIKEYILQ